MDLILLFTSISSMLLLSSAKYIPVDYQIERVYARRGANGSIPCLPAQSGTKISKLEWWKEDVKLVSIEEERMTAWGAEEHIAFLPETGALYFRSAQFEDDGDYYCVINGKNKSREGMIKLLIQDVPDSPGRPVVTNFTSRSISISWPPSFNTHHSPILHYIIHVRVSDSEEWETSKRMALGNETSYTVIGLQPFTVYEFRVLAVNDIGISKSSPSSYPLPTLSEAPDGKPTIIQYGNASSTSIFVKWAAPPKNSIHGELLGYNIKYYPRDDPSSRELIELRSPNITEYTIRNLKTFVQYKISFQVVNSAGEGPATLIAVMTDEGVPTAPLNLKTVRVGDTWIKIKWEPPKHPNGILAGYHIYLVSDHLTDYEHTQIRLVGPEHKEYKLENLKPFTSYKIWLKAFTAKNEGNSSETLNINTDVQGPSAPYIVNLTCSSLDSLFLQWQRPKTFHNRIDYYFVYYRPENSRIFNEIALNTSHERDDLELFITNLTSNILYEVKVLGATKSVVDTSRLYKGEASQSRKVVLQSKCESYLASPYSETSISASLVAAIICAFFALILAILSFILWRKYFQAAYYYLDDPPSQTRGSSPQFVETYDESDYTSIPVPLWPKHVQDLHADSDIGFSREYESIQTGSEIDLSCDYSQMIENKNKNRYVNIVAYDHSRVVLKSMPGQKKGCVDYINANYIDGYCKPSAYIGTQGPLPSTFDDYWRMIWEQRVCIIVMITNLVERGRSSRSSDWDDSRKCDMYWPKEGVETYGIIQVKLLQEVVMATYTLRTLNIRNLKMKKKHGTERTVYQYHYTNWPDHGVPDHPLPVLSFVRKSAAANPPNGGPIIVHCSAGVGRTGTYIVIDAMLKQIKHRQSINIYGFLRHIRQQRNYLVQTEEQYIFIHDALLEAIESGDTEIASSHLTRYIQTLQTGGDSISNTSSDNKEKSFHWPLLEREYKLVTSFRAKDFNVVSALKPCNKAKNRSLNLIPIEAHRSHITPRTPGTDGSDYINATFLPGFNMLKEFIITQHPIYDTFPDFWQMVWDHNAQTIVLLSPTIDEKEYPQFWPEKGEECDYGNFKVKLTEENTLIQDSGGFMVTRDFIMQSTQDDYELVCRIVYCPGWPETCGPLSSVFDLIKMVQTWHVEYQNGPIIVLDRYGGTEAATFCCLTTLYKQLNFEDCVDVYMYAKLYHLRRPGIWRSQDDYLFIYRAIESLVSTMNLNEDVDNSPYGSQLNVSNGHLNTNGQVVKINISSDHSVKSESLA